MPDPIKEYLSSIGKKGGKRSLETMTPEQRKERARKAGSTKWKKNNSKEN